MSWHIYNDTKNKKLFGITLDNSNSNTSNPWSLRIGHYYGSETPQYFMVSFYKKKNITKPLPYNSNLFYKYLYIYLSNANIYNGLKLYIKINDAS